MTASKQQVQMYDHMCSLWVCVKCPGVNDSGLREECQPRVSEPGRLLPLLCGALSAVRPHGKQGLKQGSTT
jgi:hypothetical protein